MDDEESTTTRFDRDTGLEAAGDGGYHGRVDGGWWIVRGPNGGYVAAILQRAMTLAVGDPERKARSLTVHYLRPPAEGPITVRTTVERSGRSVSATAARMFQDDRLIALALGAFSTPWPGPEFQDAAMPEVPPPEDIDPRPDVAEMPFLTRFDFRWAYGVAPLGEGGPAESGVWMRLREPRVADEAVVAQLMDAWAPAVFTKVLPPGGGVPTIDLTVHYRRSLPLAGARPEDWMLGIFRTRTAHEGFIEEDGELWTRDGRLAAQSRQLAILLGSPGG